MNTGINPTLLILSAEREIYGPEENTARSKQMAQLLTVAGLQFDETVGVYGGRPEISFVLYLPGAYNQKLMGQILQLAFADFEQESVLIVYPERTAHLVYQDGRVEVLAGKLKEVSEKELARLLAYTFMGGRYYAVTE